MRGRRWRARHALVDAGALVAREGKADVENGERTNILANGTAALPLALASTFALALTPGALAFAPALAFALALP